VGRELGVSRESMIEARRGKGDVNIGRLMAIYLIHKNCSISQKELGVIFGGVSNVAISMSISRFRKEHEHDNKISHLLLKVAHSLNVKT
jgi:chromosomal replication initiation ATPase DnaA